MGYKKLPNRHGKLTAVSKIFGNCNCSSKARDQGAIVCASPSAVKSFALKFVEILHMLTESLDQMEENKEVERTRGR
jgi:hypothetical protein